jgi:hypothetical protein
MSPAEEDKTALSSMQSRSATTQHSKPSTFAHLDGGADYYRANHITTSSDYAQPSTRPYPHQQHTGQSPLRTRNIPIVPSLPLLPRPSQRQQSQLTGSTVRDLLPYCTTEPPLNEAQVIALSDVVGSLRELVPLVLAAASGDVDSVDKLENAVGQRAAANIIEFFVDEWEIEG